MALTLPVEEMSRLQVSFQLSLPDGQLTFEMTSAAGTTPPCPQSLSGLKLHFQGTHNENGLSLKVWASGLPEQGNTTTPTAILDTSSLAAALGEKETCSGETGTIDDSMEDDSVSSSHTPHSVNSTPLSFSSELAQNPSLRPEFLWHEFGNSEFRTEDSFDYLDGLSYPQKWADLSDDMLMNSQLESSEVFPSLSSSCLATPSLPPTLLPSSLSTPYTQLNPQYDGMSLFSPITPSTPSSGPEPDTLSTSSAVTSSLHQNSSFRPTPSLTDGSTSSTRSSSPEADSTRPYQCLAPDCSRWFKRDYTRKVHMLTHRRTKERKPFGCNVSGCPERFSRKHDRLRHEVGRHGLISEWRCEPCNRFFSSKATLDRHGLDKHRDPVLPQQGS